MPSAVEIVSLGGLPTGIEYEDLSARISMPRNRALANVLFRLELIEAYGTGIGRMRESYEGEGLGPEITVAANTFSIVLPNRNAQDAKAAGDAESLPEAVIRALADGARTRAEIQAGLGVSQSTASRVLADLVGGGRGRGSGRAGGLGIACHSPSTGSRHPVGDARRLGRWAFCHMGRVGAPAAVRGLTADGYDGCVWSLASRWGLA